MFFPVNPWATTYTGARIISWPGSGAPTYGLGMTNATLVYNAQTSTIHSFQFNGVECTYILIQLE